MLIDSIFVKSALQKIDEMEFSGAMVPWVFFDVGNVIYHDDQQAFYGYQSLYHLIRSQYPEFTFSELMAAREVEARSGRQWIISHIAKSRLTPDEFMAWQQQVNLGLAEKYDVHHLLDEHTPPLLSLLREKYRLGIIANQTLACRPSLQRRGLLDSFDVVAISDELGVAKPDETIFRWAIERAGCDVSRSIMIGDRIDNDILPAKSLGMKTILVNWSTMQSKLWRPDHDLGREFLESCDRVPLFGKREYIIEADAVISSLQEVPQVIEQLLKGNSTEPGILFS